MGVLSLEELDTIRKQGYRPEVAVCFVNNNLGINNYTETLNIADNVFIHRKRNPDLSGLKF